MLQVEAGFLVMVYHTLPLLLLPLVQWDSGLKFFSKTTFLLHHKKRDTTTEGHSFVCSFVSE